MSDENVVIIEDNPTDIKVFKRVLKSSGLNEESIKPFKNGIKALKFFKRKLNDDDLGVSLIILDMKLPAMNGLEVLRRIKRNKRFRKIPVIVVSSSDQRSEIEKAYKIGVNSYIKKPTNYEDFEESLEKLKDYWLEFDQFSNL